MWIGPLLSTWSGAPTSSGRLLLRFSSIWSTPPLASPRRTGKMEAVGALRLDPGRLSILEGVPRESGFGGRDLGNGKSRAYSPLVENFVVEYNQLDRKVQERLAASVRGPRCMCVDNYLSIMRPELKTAERKLLGYSAWVTNPEADPLKEKIDAIKQPQNS